ncbi:hypothetical protein WI29_11315 [Burkholderia ubonensis]|nr:hypothetical protein WI29_11315 [Burkholderia ubonensis]KUZ68905.1 hypothetical protein WI37_29810 [Burkholderia ubonensis]
MLRCIAEMSTVSRLSARFPRDARRTPFSFLHQPLPAIARVGVRSGSGRMWRKQAKFVHRQDAVRQFSVQFARQAAVVGTRRALAARGPAVLLNDTQANEP